MIAQRTQELTRRALRVLAPPPRLTVSEWADNNRILPQSSAEPGQWRTDRTPYLRAPMDACSDPGVRKIVLIFASQTGKTELLLNIAGYFVEHDPANILMIQPTVEMAQAFSKDRVEPMLQDTPSLAGKVAESKSRTTGNTIQRKQFPGGSLTIIGANAPAPLASRFMRVVLPDEVDRFPISAGTEGDPLKLAEVRQTTFWNALTVVTSTPTVKGESRIEAEYENSSREEWCVPCPGCGELQPYEWARFRFNDHEGESGIPEMICKSCGELHSEYDWKARPGRWVAGVDNPTVRGFRLNALASPWLSWEQLIAEFRDAKAKGAEVLKTFVNTRLAESWEEAGEGIDAVAISAKRDYYQDSDELEASAIVTSDLPPQVRFVTMGVDVQKDRLEYEIVGWGLGKESWGIQYGYVLGDPQIPETWDELDSVAMRQYTRIDGAVLSIHCVAVDSGYATSAVYAYAARRVARNIYAIKGRGGPGLPVLGKYTRQGKARNVPVFPVGTDAAKDLVFSRFNTTTPGPDYCHYPPPEANIGGQWHGYDEDYFRGLTSEHRVARRHMGQVFHSWVKKTAHVRNEPLDCRVYATAALEIRNPDLMHDRYTVTKPAQPEQGEQAQPVTRSAPRRRIYSRGIQ